MNKICTQTVQKNSLYGNGWTTYTAVTVNKYQVDTTMDIHVFYRVKNKGFLGRAMCIKLTMADRLQLVCICICAYGLNEFGANRVYE